MRSICAVEIRAAYPILGHLWHYLDVGLAAKSCVYNAPVKSSPGLSLQTGSLWVEEARQISVLFNGNIMLIVLRSGDMY